MDHVPKKGKPMNSDDLIRKFREHWDKRVDTGKSSPMSILELLSVDIAFQWLVKHYSVTPKEK